MNGNLSIGQALITPKGVPLRVEELFGSGGQGEVYRVSTPRGDRAVKWYYPNMATPDQREIIETLVAGRIADPRFLWPQSLVLDPNAPGSSFGYLKFASGMHEALDREGAQHVQGQLEGWLTRAAGFSGDDTTLVGVYIAG